MNGINKVIIVGTLGRDPEVRHFQDGTAVANCSMATSERWKDKNSGEMQEKTEWHRVVFFRRLAEIAGEYLTKGSKVYVEGKLQTRKWEDKDGHERYTTGIVAREMQMLGDKGQAKSNGAGEYLAPERQQKKVPPPKQQQSLSDFDDDIPF